MPGNGASRCSRSSSPSARSSRGPSPGGRDRDAGIREPAVRPGRARAAPRRRDRRGDGRAARAGRRRPRRAAARRRGPLRAAPRPGQVRSASNGPAPNGRRLRRPGEHPRSVPRPSTGSRHVRGDGRQAARASDCSIVSPRHRPRAATAAASSRQRCSSSSGTAATPELSDSLVDLRVDDHERPIDELGASTRCTTGSSASRRARSGFHRGRAPTRSPSASRGLGYDSLDVLGRRGEPRGAGRRRERDRPRRPRGAPRSLGLPANFPRNTKRNPATHRQMASCARLPVAIGSRWARGCAYSRVGWSRCRRRGGPQPVLAARLQRAADGGCTLCESRGSPLKARSWAGPGRGGEIPLSEPSRRAVPVRPRQTDTLSYLHSQGGRDAIETASRGSREESAPQIRGRVLRRGVRRGVRCAAWRSHRWT